MRHLDEGTIHAWLDGALDAEESRAIETHLAECASCAGEVAEARGLIAASSRILAALDAVPGGVIPDDDTGGSDGSAAAKDDAPSTGTPRRASPRPRWRIPGYARAAAAVMLVTAGAIALARTERIAPRPASEASSRVVRTSAERAAPPMAPAPASAPAARPSAPAADTAIARAAPRAEPSAPSDVAPRRSNRAEAPRVAFSPRAGNAGARPPAPDTHAFAMADSATGMPSGRDSAARREAESAIADGLAGAMASPGGAAVTRPRGGASMVAGRVTDERGAPVAGASVVVSSQESARAFATTDARGEYAITLPDTLGSRAATITVRRIGYRAVTDSVIPAPRTTVVRDLTMPATPLSLSEVVVTQQGAAERRSAAGARPTDSVMRAPSDSAPRLAESAKALSPRIRLVRSDSVADGDRIVRRRIYEVRPGVRVTLAAAALIADRQAPMDGRFRAARPSARPAPDAESAESLAVGVNSIQWTGVDGTRYTLSGRLPVAELSRLKDLVR
ncbi:MAG TPA: carboxypeptidase regulatory-like domain-containing protein [Gemmatimonadaceae bacterium]